jgi:hypothetical protein
MPKKRGLRMLTKTVKRTVREASSKNPPFWAEAFYVVAPAVASYAVTRLAGRASRVYIGRRYPKLRPYLPLAGSLAAAGVMYYATTKVSDLKRFKTAVMVGAGIALTQTLLLQVMPQAAWLFDLPTPSRALGGGAQPATPLLAADAALDRMEAQAAGQASVGEVVDEVASDEAGDDLGGAEGLADGWESPLVN